jgi:NTP-dependent ternary system trypsin peptidase co-occuring protein
MDNSINNDHGWGFAPRFPALTAGRHVLTKAAGLRRVSSGAGPGPPRSVPSGWQSRYPGGLDDRGRLGVYCGQMAERDVGPADGLGLADAIGLLRDELLEAQAAGAGSEIQLPVESMTVQLTVAATRSRDGKAGFRSLSWSWSCVGARAGSVARNRW